MTEIWEPHPVYPHEGSNLGRARTRTGRVLAQRPNNRPVDAPPDQRYQLIDLWIPGVDGGKGKRVTVSVHTFITECHWGMKKYRRQEARHGPLGPAVNSWDNLLGWGFPSDNAMDKPPEVRAAAARTARAAQLAALPRRKRRRRSRKVTLKVTFRLPWAARRKPVSKPITKGAA